MTTTANLTTNNNYNIVSPWKANFSVGTTIANRIAVGVEYEITDHTSGQVRNTDVAEGYYDWSTGKHDKDLQHDINKYTNDTHTLRLGLEYLVNRNLALRAGYKYARQAGYDCAIQVDADGQHDPKGIRTVLAGLEDVNISIGSRFAEATNYKVSGPRKWAMVVLARMFTMISGEKFTDATSGFRAADRKAIEQYCEHLPAEYLGDCIDACVMAIRSGLTVKQVPVEMRERQGGTPSSSPWKSAVYLVRSFFSFGMSMTRQKTNVGSK